MTIRCTHFGVEALAAHSIMMRLFFFFACFGDSLSQTAQSFLPALLYPKDRSNSGSRAARTQQSLDLTRMMRRLLTMSVGIGILNSQVSTLLVKCCGQYLTKNGAITGLLKKYSNYMGLALLVHPFIMLLEGIVLANRDFRTLMVTYTTTMVMHFTILANFSNSFPAVWRTFFLFQCTRLSLYAYRVLTWWWAQRPSSFPDNLNDSSSSRPAAISG
jgi:Na+-driven multidrug efflux pump